MDIPSIVGLILTAVLCYFVSATVHELGHIIVGLLHGWRLFLLVVGPFGIRRNEKGKLSLYLEKNPALWGGVGGTFPQTESAENLKIWSKILLGGPVVSVIMGCIFLPIGIVTQNIVPVLLGAMPVAMGIACLLPLKTGIMYTDGMRWRRIRNGGQAAAEEAALFKLTENNFLGTGILEFANFEALLDADLPAIRYYGYYYAHLFYKDKRDEDKAREYIALMDAIKKNVPKVIIDDCNLLNAETRTI